MFNQKQIFKITYIVDISAAGLLQNEVKTVRYNGYMKIHRNRLFRRLSVFQI